MKPFVILQIRKNDRASENEFEAFVRFSGLKETDFLRVRMEQDGIPPLNLDDYSGIIVAGGPANVSDKEEKKPDFQKRFEAQLYELLDEIVEKDFPFLGACYGFGALVVHQGGIDSKERYAETGVVDISLSEVAKTDPLLQDLPETFRAIVGHKESCQQVPESAVNLASSPTCPFQLLRVKNNVYATQFHPELTVPDLIFRLEIYKDAGYVDPNEIASMAEAFKNEKISIPMEILRRFVERYKRD